MPDSSKLTAPLNGLTGCFVAGGAITSLYTNKPINDFDVYPKTEAALIEAVRWAYEDSEYWCVDHSTRAMTFAKGDECQIQIMHFDTFETADKIFDTFDFTCCMGSFDLDEGAFILHPKFLEHCSQRFLCFNRNTRFPYASGWRVNKYRDKGFTIGKIEYQKILLACSQKPINSWEDLKEQVGGVYGEAITIPEGEEFTQDGVWRAIETLSFKGASGGFESLAHAIISISRKPVRCFSNNGELYADIYGDNSFEKVPREPKIPVYLPIDEALGTTFYKKVIVKDGRYFGPHRTTFEYRIGDLAVSPAGPGIYCYANREQAEAHSVWDGGKGGYAVLELQVEEASDICFGDQITLKKARVVAAHNLMKEAA